MGIESGKDKPKVQAKPKVSMVVHKAESQDQHYKRIEQKQKKLDDKAVGREDSVKRVDATDTEVGTLRKVHTKQKLRLKTSAAVRLQTRGEYGFMLKSGVQLKLGKVFQVKLGQEVSLSGKPGEKAAGLYKLKLETKALGAVLGIEGYQQKDKRKMYFGYTVSGGRSLKITFLGQYEKTPDEKTISARVKLSKKISRKTRLFADVTLNNPNKPGSLKLSDVEGVVGLNLPNGQTISFYTNPGDKRFVLTYFGRF